jgi:hypothetical protein
MGAGRKCRREQGNDGIPKPPTKKKITVQHSKKKKQNVTEIASTSKGKKEAHKQIVVEITGTSKAKNGATKQIVAKTTCTSKVKDEQHK